MYFMQNHKHVVFINTKAVRDLGSGYPVIKDAVMAAGQTLLFIPEMRKASL